MPRELSLSVEIAPAEILLRSLRKLDVNRELGQVKPGSLKPGSKGRGSISLIRQAIGIEHCVAATREHVHKTNFWGFGAATASRLQSHASDIVDDRETFLGHANMMLDFEIPPGPPNTPPEMTEAYEIAMKRLLAIAQELAVVAHAEAETEESTSGGSPAS